MSPAPGSPAGPVTGPVTGLVAVLAAGLGTRFGGGKLDAPCAGRPLGSWAAGTAQTLGWPVAAVVGPERPAFADDPALAGADWIGNPDPAAGLGGSLALAARAAQARGAGLLLVVLADMPLVSAATLAQLAARAAAHGMAAVRYPDGRRGVPACFAAAHFAALAGLRGEAGARDLLRACPAPALVDPPPDELRDVDTPADLAAAAALLGAAR